MSYNDYLKNYCFTSKYQKSGRGGLGNLSERRMPATNHLIDQCVVK